MHSKEIEQLRRELAIERITVSKAVADLIQFTVDNRGRDPFLSGVPSDHPSRKSSKSKCVVV